MQFSFIVVFEREKDPITTPVKWGQKWGQAIIIKYVISMSRCPVFIADKCPVEATLPWRQLSLDYSRG